MSKRADRGRSTLLPLHAEVFGSEGPPLLLLHGFGTNGFTWSRWIQELSRDFRVHVVELKGFGHAPKPRDGLYSPADQATLIHHWILQNDLRDLTLVGHSLGGGVALLTALSFLHSDPDRIRALAILAGIAYPQPVSRYLRILGNPLWGPLLLRLFPSRLVIRTALRKAYHPSHPVSASYVEAYAHLLRFPDGRYVLSRSAAQFQTPEAMSAIDRYPEMDIPTLLLWGRNDPVVPLWVGERLAVDLPRARLEVLEDCGHMPQEEAPQEALEHLLPFLSETAGKAGGG